MECVLAYIGLALLFWFSIFKKSGKNLRFWSDESEIGGFVKLLVSEGARVQVYSAHAFPENEKE